jgi:hypothetical protein
MALVFLRKHPQRRLFLAFFSFYPFEKVKNSRISFNKIPPKQLSARDHSRETKASSWDLMVQNLMEGVEMEEERNFLPPTTVQKLIIKFKLEQKLTIPEEEMGKFSWFQYSCAFCFFNFICRRGRNNNKRKAFLSRDSCRNLLMLLLCGRTNFIPHLFPSFSLPLTQAYRNKFN